MSPANDATRINLVRFHAVRLSLTTPFNADASLLTERLPGYAVKQAEGGDAALFLTQYRRSRANHYCVGTIVQARDGSDEFEFDLTYSTSPKVSVSSPGATRSVKDMLQMLSDLPGTQSFVCRAAFDYPREGYISRVGLPVVVSPESDLPFSEVRGMRFLKAEGEEVEYDAIVDLGSSGVRTVLHSIGFFYLGQFGVDLPAGVYSIARGVSAVFGRPS